jgi:hypothetical protein
MAECQMLLTGFFAEFVGIAVLNLQNACYSIPCYGSPPAVDNYVHFWYMSEKMYFYFSIFNLLILELLEEELGSQMSKEVGS